MRDQLTEPRRPTRFREAPAPTPPTQALDFDETVIRNMVATEVATPPVGGVIVWPPIPLYTIPPAIEWSELLQLAVNGTPEQAFANGFWWQLQLGSGPAQEFQPRTRLIVFPGSTSQWTGLPIGPNDTAGVRGVRYGSLMHPRRVNIRLPQSAEITLQLYSNAGPPQAFNIYTRVAGANHYQAG